MFVMLLTATIGVHVFTFWDDKHPYVGRAPCIAAANRLIKKVDPSVPGDLTIVCKREHRA